MAQPNDYSYPHESATGICNECGAIVTFGPNEMTAQCPVCMTRPHRAVTGAVSETFQRGGYRVGANVVPRCPR